MAQVLHLTGPVLVGADDVRPQGWVVGGRITYAAPTGDHDVTTVPGWVLPGLVDAHSHIGLGAHGAVDDATAEEQALADRDAGALLLRDAGSPADTRWVQARDDLPRLVRAGRHIARTRRYIRNFAWEIEPDQLVEQVRAEAKAGPVEKELTEDDVLRVLAKEVKKRRESAQIYTDAGAAERAATETLEADLIETYLPARLSDEDLAALVTAVVADLGASSLRDMGAVMKEAGARAGGAADGKKLSTLVRAALAG